MVAVMSVSSGIFIFWVVCFVIVYSKIKPNQTPSYVLCVCERKTCTCSDVSPFLAEKKSRQYPSHPAWFVIERLWDVLGQNNW